MTAIDLIAQVRSGIAQVALERDRHVLGHGSAFLVERGLLTNSHVIRPPESIDTVVIRFEDSDEPIRLLPEACYDSIIVESSERDRDYALLDFSEPEIENRHCFEFGNLSDVSIGEQVLFLGFPFGMPQLTAHMGHISSIHERQSRTIIQIDGSVNGGNSGGPLVDLKSGNVVGIVTRAVTGIVEQEFDNLIMTLRNNQRLLSQTRSWMSISGVDPVAGLKASQAAMEQIARNLKRSANVGIGYAFCSDYVRDQIGDFNSA